MSEEMAYWGKGSLTLLGLWLLLGLFVWFYVMALGLKNGRASFSGRDFSMIPVCMVLGPITLYIMWRQAGE